MYVERSHKHWKTDLSVLLIRKLRLLLSFSSSPRRTGWRFTNTCLKKGCFMQRRTSIFRSIPNLQVIKLMQSFKSKEYVKENFAWMHYYWYLTNDGIEYLRTYLNLPSEIVPATLKKSTRPPGRQMGGPPGDRPRGPPRDGDRPRFSDRDGYRGGAPRGPGSFGDKAGAPEGFQPSFRGGPGGRPIGGVRFAKHGEG